MNLRFIICSALLLNSSLYGMDETTRLIERPTSNDKIIAAVTLPAHRTCSALACIMLTAFCIATLKGDKPNRPCHLHRSTPYVNVSMDFNDGDTVRYDNVCSYRLFSATDERSITHNAFHAAIFGCLTPFEPNYPFDEPTICLNASSPRSDGTCMHWSDVEKDLKHKCNQINQNAKKALQRQNDALASRLKRKTKYKNNKR